MIHFYYDAYGLRIEHHRVFMKIVSRDKNWQWSNIDFRFCIRKIITLLNKFLRDTQPKTAGIYIFMEWKIFERRLQKMLRNESEIAYTCITEMKNMQHKTSFISIYQIHACVPLRWKNFYRISQKNTGKSYREKSKMQLLYATSIDIVDTSVRDFLSWQWAIIRSAYKYLRSIFTYSYHWSRNEYFTIRCILREPGDQWTSTI